MSLHGNSVPNSENGEITEILHISQSNSHTMYVSIYLRNSTRRNVSVEHMVLKLKLYWKYIIYIMHAIITENPQQINRKRIT